MLEKRVKALVLWLGEALDLEYSLMNIYERHAASANFADPEVSGRIEVFLSKGKEHALILGDCIGRLGGKAGSEKGLHGVVKGALMNLAESAPKDNEIHRLTDEWTLEQSQILRLTAIVAAARHLEDSETAMAAESVLAEKRAMVTWFEEYLPQAVKDYLDAES